MNERCSPDAFTVAKCVPDCNAATCSGLPTLIIDRALQAAPEKCDARAGCTVSGQGLS